MRDVPFERTTKEVQRVHETHSHSSQRRDSPSQRVPNKAQRIALALPSWAEELRQQTVLRQALRFPACKYAFLQLAKVNVRATKVSCPPSIQTVSSFLRVRLLSHFTKNTRVTSQTVKRTCTLRSAQSDKRREAKRFWHVFSSLRTLSSWSAWSSYCGGMPLI